MKKILQKLIAGEKLDEKEFLVAFKHVLSNECPIKSAAFLALLEAKGVQAEQLQLAVGLLREQGTSLTYDKPLLDIVGTGGDYQNTFNISTGSAILASACGLLVAKHGNRSVSSNCGSADIIEQLGIHLELSQKETLHSLAKVGMTFLFAPLFNPALKSLKTIRKSLEIRTIFNLLGPLLNPLNPHFMLVGVADEKLLDSYAKALQLLGKRALLFCSEGVDELVPCFNARLKWISAEGIQEQVLNPQEVGIAECELRDLRGSSAQENAQKLVATLKGQKGPWAETLILNAGSALYLCKEVTSLKEGVKRARKVQLSGQGYQKLQQWLEFSKSSKGL